MTFYNHIESVRGIAIDLTNGRKWRGASDKAAVFDALDAARREYMRLSDENAKLRKLAVGMYGMLEMVDKILGNHDACETPRPLIFGEDKSFKDVMRELGVEVTA